MSEDVPRPKRSDGTSAWAAYWRAIGQPWRCAPEIDAARQRELTQRRSVPLTDFDTGPFPFAGIRLERADVEWLLGAPYVGAPLSAEFLGAESVAHERDEAEPRGDRVQLHDVCYMTNGRLQYERPLGLDLRGAHLEGVDLSGLPLAGLWGGDWPERGGGELGERAAIHLEGAVLHGTDLSHAILGGAYLGGADLSFATLTQAELSGADLVEANLDGAQLLHAGLSCADMRQTTLRRASLLGADLRTAHLDEADLTRADLRGADLFGASLRRARGCRPPVSQRTGSAMPSSSASSLHFLEGADLRGARLDHVCAEGADLRWTRLAGASLCNALLIGVDLTEADLRGADLCATRLEGARLVRTRLAGANLSDECTDPEVVRVVRGEVHLDGADLRGADLRGACLRGVYLAGARLEDALLGRADLRGARLERDEPMPAGLLAYIRRWCPDFPDALPPTALHVAVVDTSTLLPPQPVSAEEARWAHAGAPPPRTHSIVGLDDSSHWWERMPT